MNKKMKFKEKSRYNDVVVLGGIGLLSIVLLAGLANTWISGQASAGSTIVFLATAVILGFLWYSLSSLRMKVSVTPKHIKYQLKPLQSEAHKIKWENVASCRLVESYDNGLLSICQNIHFSRLKWYSLAGHNGLEVTTHAGDRYFIGCNNTDELSELLESMPLADRR
jgi:hypothetical protein